MPTVFLSYSRSELPQVRTLTQHLRTGGYDFWFDQELTGGQQWWNEVVRRIFECDVFLAVISEHSLRSNACTLELQYAVALGKPLLPVMVEQVSPRFLSPELGRVQVVDYRTPTVDAALRLMAALRTLPPAPPPPYPYPQPPPAPESYLNTFREWVETQRVLERAEQVQLLADIKHRLGGDDAPDLFRLLRTFRARPDLIVAIRDEIDELLRRQATSPRAGSPPPEVRRPGTGQRPGTGKTIARVAVGCAAAVGVFFVLLIVGSMCLALSQQSGSGGTTTNTTRNCVTSVGVWCQVTGVTPGSRCQCWYQGVLYPGVVQ